MSLKTIIPPAAEPLTLAEAKTYLRTDDDVTALITAAREYCEDYQNKKFVTQTLELILDRFPCGREIEFGDCSPIQSVTSIKYYDTEGTEHTLPDTDYIVDTDSFVARVVLGYQKSWPTVTLKPIGGVVIRFVAGYPPNTEKVHTGETLGTGDGTEKTFLLDNAPVKSIEAVYFDGVKTDEYTADLSTNSITATPANEVVVTADYTQTVLELAANVPEAVKQAMVLHMQLLYDSLSPEQAVRTERARDALLGMRRRIPI